MPCKYPYKPDSTKCPTDLKPGESMVDNIARGILDVIERCAICKCYIGYSLPADDYEPAQPALCLDCSRHVEIHFSELPE
jgi:hypothetical protein